MYLNPTKLVEGLLMMGCKKKRLLMMVPLHPREKLPKHCHSDLNKAF